ncbi:MAG: hypothetical protein ACRECT_08955 [Thermoplasmata archaeon]
MSVLPRYRAIASGAVVAVLALGLLAVPASAAGTPGAVGSGSSINLQPCTGPLLPHNYTGTEFVNGAPNGSAATVAFQYEVDVLMFFAGGSNVSNLCESANGTVDPAPDGAFAISIDPTPVTNCTIVLGNPLGTCTTTEGPYVSLSAAVASPLPRGFVSSVIENGTAFRVNVDSDLARVVFTPGSPTATFSPGAPDEVTAAGTTGSGGAPPGVPTYAWSLSGVGWSFVAPARGGTVNVTASVGAAAGELTVVASLAVDGTTLVTPAFDLQLVAAPTTVASAVLGRTMVDVNDSVIATATASGAPGYAYTAIVDPGLGEAAVSAPCSTAPGREGLIALSCSVAFGYASAGVAQPVLSVTNGYSAADWSFPDVTVDLAPQVALTPLDPVGYADAMVPIVVRAHGGTAPFEQGCLATGVDPEVCLESPGPNWTFAPVFPETGEYSALAWTVDATGANRSASAVVRIVPSPALFLSENATDVTAGAPATLTAVVSGGDLPARVWWNVTDATVPGSSAPVSMDGPVFATFTPSAAGFLDVSVTVVDGLGTAVSAARTWTVGPPVVTSVTPLGLPTAAPAPAGSPLTFDWQALDASGSPVHNFSSTAEVELVRADSGLPAPGWVNASGVGPLASRLPGWFTVPAAAWIGGALNVSVTSRLAGTLEVGLTVAAGLPSGGGPILITVLPDNHHLTLFDPDAVRAGERASATLWQVTDRFGNPAPGATVVTTELFDGLTTRTLTLAVPTPGGGSEVWVNVSAPDLFAGTVTVTDLAGDALLPSIAVPGLANPATALLAAFAPAIAAVVGAGVGTVAFLRTRRPRPAALGPSDDAEEALQRLAEGRASVVEVVGRSGPIDLASLEAGWQPPPAPPDLADWVASLLTDGSLDATVGADGVARFCVPPPGRDGLPVTVDVEAFDRAERRRDEERAEWRSSDP